MKNIPWWKPHLALCSSDNNIIPSLLVLLCVCLLVLAAWRMLSPSTSNSITDGRTCTKWLDYSHLSPHNLVILLSGCTVKWGWSPTSADAQSGLRSDARSPNDTRFWRGMWHSERKERANQPFYFSHIRQIVKTIARPQETKLTIFSPPPLNLHFSASVSFLLML